MLSHGYLSHCTKATNSQSHKLPSIVRLIIGFLLYIWLCTNIGLNLITVDQPGFEPKFLGPKVATLPMCYAPLILLSNFCLKHVLPTFVKLIKSLFHLLSTNIIQHIVETDSLTILFKAPRQTSVERGNRNVL